MALRYEFGAALLCRYVHVYYTSTVGYTVITLLFVY